VGRAGLALILLMGVAGAGGTLRAGEGDAVGGTGPQPGSSWLTLAPPSAQGAAVWVAVVLAVVAMVALASRLRGVRLRARERDLVLLVERRTAEARSAQEAAEQANRAKDRFLAVLGHELRTPLTPVLLSVGHLLEREVDPEARRHLEMIRRNLELEARLVDDLLDLSRIERGLLSLDLEVVDVHEVIGHALEICFAEVFMAELAVVESLAAEEHHARADAARLMQVFWNLIRNAAKFGPAGSALTIRSWNEEMPPAGPACGSPSERTAQPITRLLVVAFEDNGRGIELELLDRIFAPFEQGDEATRRRGAGLGLGLAISRAVAEAHGGRLTATSPGKGQGATFRLELAVAAAPAPAPRPSRIDPAAEAPIRRPTGLKILLVEDNADTLCYLDLILRRHGDDVTAASTLAAARRALAGGDFDLLISDIELPDGSGLELLRELRGRTLPAIALSGYGAEEDLRESRSAGFAIHLIKPVLAEALDEAIAHVVSRARQAHTAAGPGPASRRLAGPRSLTAQPLGGPSGA
jgi:signal transduction histidine kinase/CheY-like chemotaxis protein